MILPSLLLPVRYSSLVIIIATLASIYNLIYKKNKKLLLNYLFIPFLIYFASIIITFIIDLYNNQLDTTFLSRNLSLLLVPLFVFTSNFTKKQIINILKTTSVIISLIGISFLFLWVIGYYKYDNQQEFQKKEWFKNEIITPNDYLNQEENYEIEIKPFVKNPSLRKVIMLTEKQSENFVTRELFIKVKKNIGKNIWVLLRGLNSGNQKVWFNISNGKVGYVEGEANVKSEKTFDGFYKLTFTNKPKKNSTREWFYISFVSNNGSYRWDSVINESIYLELKEPKLYLDTNENLLLTRNLFDYKITNFSNLENYAHSTYFGLVFTFALIILIFNSFLKNFIRISLILLLVLIIIALTSKAIIISLIFLIPFYYLFNYFNYKHLIILVIFGVFIGLNGHVKERFNDLITTVINVNEEKNLGDLESLSTNNRIFIYKNYLSLIKSNFIVGFGFKNGEEISKPIFNYNFNAHNQYLQSLFNAGVIGLFSLILFCISPFIIKRKNMKENNGLELVIILILFNFLFESLLFRQWGLVFISFTFAIYFQFFKSNLRWFR